MKRNCYRSWYSLGFQCALLMAVLAISGGCKSHKKTVRNTFTPQEEIIIEREAESSLKGEELRVIEEAFEWMNTPYVYGGEEKGKGTDCSGMVMVIYEKTIGCKLPRISYKQAEFCEEINEHHVKPGDLVFFITNSGNRINHVGIMIDDKKFIHASSHGVVISTMEGDYYKAHFQKYGRVPCMKH